MTTGLRASLRGLRACRLPAARELKGLGELGPGREASDEEREPQQQKQQRRRKQRRQQRPPPPAFRGRRGPPGRPLPQPRGSPGRNRPAGAGVGAPRAPAREREGRRRAAGEGRQGGPGEVLSRAEVGPRGRGRKGGRRGEEEEKERGRLCWRSSSLGRVRDFLFFFFSVFFFFFTFAFFCARRFFPISSPSLCLFFSRLFVTCPSFSDSGECKKEMRIISYSLCFTEMFSFFSFSFHSLFLLLLSSSFFSFSVSSSSFFQT